MNYELFVSLRYLRAKRKQTFISVISFISIAGITLGVAALIVVLAVMTGFHDGVRQQILGNIPHVLIQKHGEELAAPDDIVDKARAASPHVLSATPFVSKEAMLLSNRNVAAVSVKGVKRDNKVFRQSFLTQDDQAVETLIFDRESALPGILIGLDTATSLGVAVGDSINVIPPMFTITPFGMIPKMKPFEVVGIFAQRGGFVEAYFAYISLPVAQDFFDLNEMVSGVEVEVDSFGHAQPVAGAIRQDYKFPYVVRSWEDMFGSFLSALKLEKLGLFIVLGIIVLVAAFNIATTLIMVVMEKHRDIAILRSMGATARSIMQIFVFEGLIIGTLGTLLGTGLGLVLAKNADPLIKWLEKVLNVKIFDQSVYGMDHFPSANYYDPSFWTRKGIKGLTISKEITLEDIAEISRKSSIEISIIGHGYLNMFHSRRPLIENFLKFNEKEYGKYLENRNLHLIEEIRDESYPVFQDKHGTHIFRDKSLESYQEIDELKNHLDVFIIDGIFTDNQYLVETLKNYKSLIDNFSAKKAQKISLSYKEKHDSGFLYKKTVYDKY